MSVGTILLILAGLLILFGVGQRVLDRLRLTDRQALLFIALIVLGGLAPDVRISDAFAINLGGAVIPLALCVYLFIKADSFSEKAYSEEDIERLLEECGFELLAKYGDDSFSPPEETSQRIVYAARCIRNGQTI